MMRLVVLMLLAVILPTVASAKIVTVISTGSSVIEKGMSRSDARGVAIIYAKQNAVEEAGTIVRSVFKKSVKYNGNKTASFELKAFSSALIKTKVLSVKYKKKECTVRIKATLNTKDVEKHIVIDDDMREQLKILMSRQKFLMKELDRVKAEKGAALTKVTYAARPVRDILKDYQKFEKTYSKTVKSYKSLVRNGKIYKMKYQVLLDSFKMILQEYLMVNKVHAEVKTIMNGMIYVKVFNSRKVYIKSIMKKYAKKLEKIGFRMGCLSDHRPLYKDDDNALLQSVYSRDAILEKMLDDKEHGMTKDYIQANIKVTNSSGKMLCKNKIVLFNFISEGTGVNVDTFLNDEVFSCKQVSRIRDDEDVKAQIVITTYKY